MPSGDNQNARSGGEDGDGLRSLAAVAAQRYQHPEDQAALQGLQAMSGLEDLIRKQSEEGFERDARIENIANAIRVGEHQFPKLNLAFRNACARLGVSRSTELYMSSGFNAFTAGTEQPYVMLGAELVHALEDDELLFVMGHELGHIRFRHVLYHQLAAMGTSWIGSIPAVGEMLQQRLLAKLFHWIRMAEFSADRAGLLACQDFEAAGRCLVKLIGVPVALGEQINLDACLQQARDLEALMEDTGFQSRRAAKEAPLDHPWPIVRLAQLHHWFTAGEYRLLLNSAPRIRAGGRVLSPRNAMQIDCPKCDRTVPAADRFCSYCGVLLSGDSGGHPESRSN